MKKTVELGISPNYTTNGMNMTDEVLEATLKYVEGVAISCHPHLKRLWKITTEKLLENNVFLNFHLIISDKQSVDYFIDIYKEYNERMRYFVLLPYMNQGRAKEKKVLEWEYLVSQTKKHCDAEKVAFGANFFPYLKKKNSFNVSLYEPEILSKYLVLNDTMDVYPSSFSTN